MYKVCPFQYGAHQAIVIPEDIAFEEGVTLEVHKEGDTLILKPQPSCWAATQGQSKTKGTTSETMIFSSDSSSSGSHHSVRKH